MCPLYENIDTKIKNGLVKLMSKFRTLIKLLIGLACGIFPAIWIIQNNRYIKQITVQPILKHLEKKWNAKVTVKDAEINLFSGTITFKNLKIKSLAKVGCTWLCKRGAIQILKRSSFSDNRLNLIIELNENTIKTEYKDGQVGMFILL